MERTVPKIDDSLIPSIGASRSVLSMRYSSGSYLTRIETHDAVEVEAARHVYEIERPGQIGRLPHSHFLSVRDRKYESVFVPRGSLLFTARNGYVEISCEGWEKTDRQPELAISIVENIVAKIEIALAKR